MNRGAFLGIGIFVLTVLSSANLMAAEDIVTANVEDLLTESLNSVDENYQGQHQFFGDDIIGNLFSNITTALKEAIITPWLNGIARGDRLSLITAGILIIISIGFFHRMGGRIFDALVGRSAVPKGDDPKNP